MNSLHWHILHTEEGLECYFCGHEEEECNAEVHGTEVRCQMDDPENHNYGDSCYVGHSGTVCVTLIRILSSLNKRGCVNEVYVTYFRNRTRMLLLFWTCGYRA